MIITIIMINMNISPFSNVTGLFMPKTFCSEERKIPMRNICSEHLFLGPFVLGNSEIKVLIIIHNVCSCSVTVNKKAMHYCEVTC